MWTLASNSTPTARKTHICDHCRKEIAVGEKYHRVDGIWEGKFTSFKEHSECHELATEIMKLNVYSYGEGICLWEDLEDPDEIEWVIKEYPIVAERLGLRKDARDD